MAHSSQDQNSFLPGYNNATDYVQDALRAILSATKSANELPAPGDSFDYYNTFPGFRAVMQRRRKAILSLMTSIIQNHGIRENFAGRELEEMLDLLIDVNDVILENASTCLDEAEGLKKPVEDLILAVKPTASINTSWNKKQFNSGSPQSYKLLTAKNIQRPQLLFKDKIDNSNSIFVPIIKEKPNSIKPLAIVLEGDKDEFCHPYELEIEKFAVSDEDLNIVEAVMPNPLDETPLIMVKTEDELKQLCADLKRAKEFAVDLEHHSYRSFQGFTCLMQISTREKDWIVDTLALRSELHLLNDVFTDPKIVKVFHGADMDILWLQRDFGIYVVNMFDTGQAARLLHFAHLSLTYLLKHYCKIDVDKKFQLADWRIRPLPSEMIKYARDDTHHLLYIYDCMRNDLIENGNETKNLLIATIERSKLVCAKKYHKPIFSEDKYMDLYKKSRKIFNTKQLYCLKQLYVWRDKIARDNDECLAYVLPNHMLLQIAEALPREQQGILACCNPIPPLVKQQLNELHSIVLKSNDSSLKQLETIELQRNVDALKTNNHIDLNSLVHCPHDIHHLEDKVNPYPFNQSESSELPIITHTPSQLPTSQFNTQPTMSALFENVTVSQDCDKSILQNVISAISALKSPFERFEITKTLSKNEKGSVQVTKNESSQNGEQIESSDEESTIDESKDESVSSEVRQNETIENADISREESLPTPDSPEMESTPLRKKKNKKRKKKMPDPDISIIDPPPKKIHIPEVVTLDDDSFTPYNYNQSDKGSFSGKKNFTKSKKNNSYQTPRPYYGKKRKHARQETYSASGSK